MCILPSTSTPIRGYNHSKPLNNRRPAKEVTGLCKLLQLDFKQRQPDAYAITVGYDAFGGPRGLGFGKGRRHGFITRRKRRLLAMGQRDPRDEYVDELLEEKRVLNAAGVESDYNPALIPVRIRPLRGMRY